MADGDDLADVDPFTRWADERFRRNRGGRSSRRAPDLVFGGLLTSALAERLASALEVPWAFVNPAYVFGKASPHSIDDDLAPGLPRHLFSELARTVLLPSEPRPPRHRSRVRPGAQPAAQPPPGGSSDTTTSPATRRADDEAANPAALRARSAPTCRAKKPSCTAQSRHSKNCELTAVVTAPGRADQLRRDHPDIRIEEFAPHDELLPASRVFITHAGHGSAMNGLVYGVPMVLVPWSRDQPRSRTPCRGTRRRNSRPSRRVCRARRCGRPSRRCLPTKRSPRRLDASPIVFATKTPSARRATSSPIPSSADRSRESSLRTTTFKR